MYGIEVITPAAGPVPAAELRDRLRLNDAAEDALLEELLAAAAERFEHDTLRPVLATTYRQHVACWAPTLVLMRGGVTEVLSVSRHLAGGGTEPLDPALWRADLLTPPARVLLAATPDAAQTAAGLPVAPAGYVEFVAGWPDPAAVPRSVRVALCLLAAHWYEHREAYRDSAFDLRALPHGWRAVCDQYRLGLSGPWGM